MALLVVRRRYMTKEMSPRAKPIGTICVILLAAMIRMHASPEEDAKAVAALDTKYQASVKANDAAAMDQILADDFALVSGRGKVYGKAGHFLKRSPDKY